MLQQVMTSPKTIVFKEVPIPELSEGEVLVKTHRIGICGSDIHVYHGQHTFTSYPVFSGFIICSDCGKKMVRSISKSNDKEYNKFICSTYKKYGSEACSCHLIQEDALTEIIKEALNKLVFSIIDFEKRINQISEKEKKKSICILEIKKKELQDNIDELMNLRSGLYSDYKLGAITLNEYHDMKAGFSENLKSQEDSIDKIDKQISDINTRNTSGNYTELIKPYMNGIKSLSRKMIIDFIEEIIVDNEKNIKIKFKFEDELKKYRFIFE